MRLNKEIDCTVRLGLHDTSDDDVAILVRDVRRRKHEVAMLWEPGNDCALTVDFDDDLEGALALVEAAKGLETSSGNHD
ncbi:hypothetical protein [Streptomyces tailanensis]|uniref:hypothetical protein n=1 Tax=Streptomyces tailanensis TaxID=2569858 RepID=UPI00155ACEDF|nr:hypothetical protein [Streptomyces tailanensis]